MSTESIFELRDGHYIRTGVPVTCYNAEQAAEEHPVEDAFDAQGLIQEAMDRQLKKNGEIREREYAEEEAKLLARKAGHSAAATGAQREKLGEIPYDLVPFQEITEAFARVAEHGAKKYTVWNWSLGLPRVQLICSLLRHTFAYLRGEERDKDSGLLHTDHILWNAAALSHNVHWDMEDGRRVEPERAYKKRA